MKRRKRVLAGILCAILLVQGTPQMTIAMQMQDATQVLEQEANADTGVANTEEDNTCSTDAEGMTEDGTTSEDEVTSEVGTVSEVETIPESGDTESVTELPNAIENSENTENVEIVEE